jgi:hypothetical protein
MAKQFIVFDRVIKIYKQSMMEKLQLGSAYELVRLIEEGVL